MDAGNVWDVNVHCELYLLLNVYCIMRCAMFL